MNICVDFGTCNTVISYTDENNNIQHILNNETGDVLIPTCLYFLNTENVTDSKFVYETDYIIGTNACNYIKQPNEYKNYFTQFKRFLGMTKKTKNIDFLNKFDYEYELDDDIIYFNIGKIKISIIELVTLFMKGIYKYINDVLHLTEYEISITCPAYFFDLQRTQLKNAVECAGFKIFKMYNEPTVAGVYYINEIMKNKIIVNKSNNNNELNNNGLNDNELNNNELNINNKTFIIFDLGGGTLDVTIIKYCEDLETCEILDICGNNNLGGIDIDNIIIENIYEKYGVDRTNKKWQNKIKKYAEDIKIKMTYTDQYDIFLEEVPLVENKINKVVDLKITYTLHNFNKLIKNIIDDMSTLVIQKAIEYNTKNIIFIGGPTKIRLIRSVIMTKLQINENNLNCELNNYFKINENLYKTIVARGGTVMTRTIKNKSSFMLLDVIPMNIGILSNCDKLAIIINKNSKIPCSSEKIFTVQHDCQRNVELEIYEGVDELCSNNNFIGSYKILGIPPFKRGAILIKLLFEITSNGILNISISGCKNSSDEDAKKTDYKYNDKIKLIPTSILKKLLKKILIS